MELNPYEELGVARDADETAIKRAYRQKCKHAHPDVDGGSPEAFERVSTALAVLIDPAKRKTYDDTGRIEADRPDNDRAAALQIIEMQVAEIVNKFILKGFDPRNDPRKIDVPRMIAAKIRAEIPTASDAILMGANILEFYRDLLKRFTLKPGNAETEDFIARQLKAQIEQAEQQVAALRVNIRVRELAITIVEAYDFRMDSPYCPSDDEYGFNSRSYGFDTMRNPQDRWPR